MVSFALYAPVKNKTMLHTITDAIIAGTIGIRKNGMMGMMLPIMLAAKTINALESAVVMGADMLSSSLIMVKSQRRFDDEMRSTILASNFPLSPFFAKMYFNSARSSVGCFCISWSSFCSRLL